MRVDIVGAGALGSVYGARLARAGSDVHVVARRARPAEVIRLERVDGRDDPITWAAPERTERVSSAADVVLVCVRYEDLDAAGAALSGAAAPVVVMTPMMPQDHARLSAIAPGRVVPAMPSVVSYRNDAGVIRYWLPRSATTLIEKRTPAGAEATIATEIERAGIRSKLVTGVLARNVATTVAFVPLAMAIDVAGGIDAVLADDRLLTLALAACEEGRALGRTVGQAEAWATVVLRFAGPRLLRASVGLARRRVPEAYSYVDRHFGRKLHAQNLAMGARIVELAREHGTRASAIAELLGRLAGAEKP